MNQHDRVEQLIAEDDERAQKARNVAAALLETERSIGLLSWHLERVLVERDDRSALGELSGYLGALRRAIRKVEDDL